ncbi:hypothetical protein R5H30_01085 [Sulfitobacter sp. D35]|uniref:hypothetical protein n=1 Tax=Sulfitobacter sp. D35 TaxID=3083252 RepID=UPI00296FD84B|nr:hypothetical protein [Sulfitobacter sp. D35]MDW4496558.1 hypothetical protein [Sulfitobacter sp. D35]
MTNENPTIDPQQLAKMEAGANATLEFASTFKKGEKHALQSRSEGPCGEEKPQEREGPKSGNERARDHYA